MHSTERRHPPHDEAKGHLMDMQPDTFLNLLLETQREHAETRRELAGLREKYEQVHEELAEMRGKLALGEEIAGAVRQGSRGTRREFLEAGLAAAGGAAV